MASWNRLSTKYEAPLYKISVIANRVVIYIGKSELDPEVLFTDPIATSPIENKPRFNFFDLCLINIVYVCNMGKLFSKFC